MEIETLLIPRPAKGKRHHKNQESLTNLKIQEIPPFQKQSKKNVAFQRKNLAIASRKNSGLIYQDQKRSSSRFNHTNDSQILRSSRNILKACKNRISSVDDRSIVATSKPVVRILDFGPSIEDIDITQADIGSKDLYKKKELQTDSSLQFLPDIKQPKIKQKLRNSRNLYALGKQTEVQESKPRVLKSMASVTNTSRAKQSPYKDFHQKIVGEV